MLRLQKAYAAIAKKGRDLVPNRETATNHTKSPKIQPENQKTGRSHERPAFLNQSIQYREGQRIGTLYAG